MEFNIDVLGKMVPNILTALTQLGATLILFYFIKKLAWKPIREILRKRSETEQNRLIEAQKLKDESEKINLQAKQELQQAGADAKQLISVGRSEAERVKNELLEDARKKSEEKLNEARKEIEYEKVLMRTELHNEMVDVALTAAEKLLSEKFDEKKDRQEIEKFVKEVVKE